MNKVETGGKVELYTIDNFLTSDQCNQLMQIIDQRAYKSQVVGGETGQTYDSGRTSYSASLHTDLPILQELDDKMFANLPEWVPKDKSETPQGQRYQIGQFFNPHNDYFDINTDAGRQHIGESGQRNWTFMIYLNDVEVGGETEFVKLGLKFQPKQGQAVIWKNVDDRGNGNPYSHHTGKPPISGKKYIITKWYRTGIPLGQLTSVTVSNESQVVTGFRTKEDLPYFHSKGYELRDLPEDIWGYIRDIYKLLKHTEAPEPNMEGFIESDEVDVASTYFNMDQVHYLKKKLHEMLLPMHSEWAGAEYELEPATCYGIRSYQRGATLAMHHDRVSELHVSGIICVDEQSDEPWPLRFQDHDGEYVELAMKPGQILLYESATCEHGRPTPFKGDYYRNFYIHYKLKDWQHVG